MLKTLPNYFKQAHLRNQGFAFGIEGQGGMA
jgi:hypothetical protein